MNLTKIEVITLLCRAMTHHHVTNEEREAMRSAISTLTWLIARRAKQRTAKKMRETNEKIESEVTK